MNEPDIVDSHGLLMKEALDEETQILREKVMTEPKVHEDPAFHEYTKQLNLLRMTVNTSLMASVHRAVNHRQVWLDSAYRGSTDLEEVTLRGEEFDLCSNDYEVEETESNSSGAEDVDSAARDAAAKKAAAPTAQDTRARKKEETKKRRVEDAMLLVKEKKVRDDRGNLIPTIGPFPPPRVTVRTAKAGQLFASRKSLTTRSTTVKEESDDEDEFVPATQGPSGDYDVTVHLETLLAPLSLESLKKISESAKLNLRPGTDNQECIQQIVKTTARLGCEKACLLMDEHKIIDAVASYCHASKPDVIAHMGTNVDFLNSLPEDLRKVLGPVLGMPKENYSVREMWERIVAMGLSIVLTNLRQKPIRRIITELNIKLPEFASTEKCSEAIIYTVFPQELDRAKACKVSKKCTDVQFSILQSLVKSVGDMGFISFVVHNVSTMRKDLERHYSPEFEFGNLKWSILCMANKDSLALYLCQTGTVHCKFVISVVNTNNDDSICNEGTQRFSSASAENDWGFNNVVKFETLLDPHLGFWATETDSITVEVGLVFVESPPLPKPTNAKEEAIQKQEQLAMQQQQKAAQPQFQSNNGGKGKKKNKDGSKEINVIMDAEKLLKEERMETFKKKFKADLSKLQKDEEAKRKDQVQRQAKAWNQVWDSQTSEKNKLTKAEKERERKEQQERKREEERCRQVMEALTDLRRRSDDLAVETEELGERKISLAEDVKSTKKAIEGGKQELSTIDAEILALQKVVDEQVKKAKRNKERIHEAKQETKRPLPKLPADFDEEDPELSSSSEEEEEENSPEADLGSSVPEATGASASQDSLPTGGDDVDEHALMGALQSSLAALIGGGDL